MQTFTIQWDRQDYGYIQIQANSLQEAKQKFIDGNYHDVNLITRGGEITLADDMEY